MNRTIDHQAVAWRLHALIGTDSQQAFAARVGIPPQFVSRYLRGTLPDPEVRLRIARTGGVTIEWVLTGRDPDRRHSRSGLPRFGGLQRLARTAQKAARAISALRREIRQIDRVSRCFSRRQRPARR